MTNAQRESLLTVVRNAWDAAQIAWELTDGMLSEEAHEIAKIAYDVATRAIKEATPASLKIACRIAVIACEFAAKLESEVHRVDEDAMYKAARHATETASRAMHALENASLA